MTAILKLSSGMPRSITISGDISLASGGAVTVTAIQSKAVSSTAPTDAQILVYNNGATQYAPVSLSGDVSITNAGVASITAATVTGKLITGFVSGAGTVSATDTILQAINKLDGNTNSKATKALDNLASVAINTSLLPGTDNSIDAGSSSKRFANLHALSALLYGSTSGAITHQANNSTTSYTIKWPAAQGGASTTIVNDGSGNLTWGASSSSSSSITKAITQTAHGFAVGDVIRYNGTSYSKSKADVDSTSEVYGMVSAVAGANDFTVTMVGYVTGLTSLTAGSTYYLSAATAGAITSTEPTTVGNVSKPVLLADTTTSGYLIQSRGAVITSSGGSGGNTLVIATKTTTYTMLNTDDVILANGTFTITMQSVATATAKAFRIKNIGTGVITIARAGSDTFDSAGATSMTLASQDVSIILVPDGTSKWMNF